MGHQHKHVHQTKKGRPQDDAAQDASVPLTEKELAKSAADDHPYQHSELDVETESERLQKIGERNAARAEEIERR